ncbi:Y-family DNA polymerase [Dyadobacter sp. MSC1_007]|jgi:protein ImuB|uniref:Y-family DNA polymerase n=1 Tax=Dyadobacter sp. MSC1_007 TaxID=2909264 RepID=UPI0020301E88|nr:DNA polymerase Y family protein [Dyadobacter sp. MSC1_007]
MLNRFISIWFPHLDTDLQVLLRPALHGLAFALAAPVRGRMVIKATSAEAEAMGIETNMVVADARAIFPSLIVLEEQPEAVTKHLKELAEWCIRYTPTVAIDPPNGLILDVTGCAYLWGGEQAYLKDIITRLRDSGYDVRAAMADTIGFAWALARFGKCRITINPPGTMENLLALPPMALRLETDTLERMSKVGFYQIKHFIHLPRRVLRRRFGQALLDRMDMALGEAHEFIESVQPVIPYQERLPCLEPIVTATGIEIALKKLLETLCARLEKEGKGLRSSVLKCFRVDGQIQQIDIVTNRASRHVTHLFKLFELKINTIAPGFGIELFLLEAPEVEGITTTQETIWDTTGGFENAEITELLDTLTARTSPEVIHRYLPDEHHWPERSVKMVSTLSEKPQFEWHNDSPRPILLLSKPELIEVTAPVPDYPPTVFRYKGKVHYVKKSDGPERIEREWWLEKGLFRDYYNVEDKQGARYWIFRLGPYSEDEGEKPEWYIHGFFA